MRQKKTVVPTVPVEGVIDLEAEVPPTATDIEARQGTGKTDVKLDPATGQIAKPKRKYTRRAKTTEKAIKDADHEVIQNALELAQVKATNLFLTYYDGKITQEEFEGRIADLKLFEKLAVKIGDYSA